MSEVIENPRGGSVLAGINSVLGAIDRVCPIYHAGPGCCMQSTASDQGQSGNKNSCFVSSVSIPSSNMLEREVVFGGTKKLKSTIQGAIDIIDADAYFVLTGCTAGIIGDDIGSVTEEFKERGHSVYPIDTPGFAGDSNLGYEVIWNALIDQVIETGVPKDERLVNVFGIIPYHDPFWSGNLEEIARILRKLGLKVNTFFTDHQGIEDIRKSSDQYEINKTLLEEEDITLLIGSSNEEEVSSLKEVQCIVAAFPIKDRLIFNRAYAGYRGSLTLTEDLYDNL